MATVNKNQAKELAKSDEGDKEVAAQNALQVYEQSDDHVSNSDEDEDPVRDAMYKKQILAWVTNADFSQEISLKDIAKHKFRLNQDEVSDFINTEGLLKIIKV